MSSLTNWSCVICLCLCSLRTNTEGKLLNSLFSVQYFPLHCIALGQSLARLSLYNTDRKEFSKLCPLFSGTNTIGPSSSNVLSVAPHFLHTRTLVYFPLKISFSSPWNCSANSRVRISSKCRKNADTSSGLPRE